MKKRSLFNSMVTYHCPKCRQTKMFKAPFKLDSPLAMNKICPHCGQDFEPEPGFYFGGMFLSYIMSGFLFLAIALTMVFGLGYSVNQAMFVVVLVGILLFFKILRFSRSLWIHMMVRYDKQFEN